MSVTSFAMCLMLGAIVTVTTTEVMAAPKELIGKSIIVTWTEERMQRSPSQSAFELQTRHGGFSVYVSSLGRVFNRLSITNGKNGKGGSVEAIGGKIDFPGKSMVAIQTQERGARRIAVTFDESYSSCTAQVIHGKAAGAGTMMGEGFHTGSRSSPDRLAARVEIESVQVSGASCSIKEGNIFGD